MAEKYHDVLDNKKVVPDLEASTGISIRSINTNTTDFYTPSGSDYYTITDPHFKDYTIPEHFTKNTGIEIKNIPAFILKELMDNSADFKEKHLYNTPAGLSLDDELSESCITATCYNDKDNNRLTIKVSNTNCQNIPFPDLNRMFSHGQSISSKAQQHRVSRGAQGNASKQFGVAGYLMYGGNDWNYPITVEHNLKEDLVFMNIDRKNNSITADVKKREDCTADYNLDVGVDGRIDTSTAEAEACQKIQQIPTSVKITLPKIDYANSANLVEFWKYYTLFNTHLSYVLHTDIGVDRTIHLLAIQRISTNFKNPTTVYAYTPKELEILLNDSADKNKSVYDALNQAGFRELNQPNRFDDLKRITISKVTSQQIVAIHKQLQKSMEPMSRLDRPYQGKTKQRKYAMIKRYKDISYDFSEKLDFDKAVYEISSPSSLKDNIYRDEKKGTQYVYYFEVLMIPIKNRDAKNKIISSVNFSTSITNKEYFSGQYTNTYQWYHNNGNGDLLQASDLDEVIMKSMIGRNTYYIDSSSAKKLRMPCVVIAHLVSQKVDYRGGYGKSQLVLEPFAEDIAITIERALRRVPTKEKYYPSDKIKPTALTTLLTDLLIERWHSVCANPKILDPYSIEYYDPWSQSTVWYHFSEDKLKPIREKISGEIHNYRRYEYIYNDFTYLTGLRTAHIITDDYLANPDSDDVKKVIADAMQRRPHNSAKRIELDSVMKVVRANTFGEFLVEMIRQHFPILDYNRAMTQPKEYFTDKINILPENVKQLFIYLTERADIAIKPIDENIVNELGQTSGLLDIALEEITNEKLRAEAISTTPEMQEIDAKCRDLLDNIGGGQSD